ncbi:uncharacterized protein LOC111627144 [Centruroides sculpturatus]|uniref:uncharacterized protein LOC111627144 n=1 Tax=Centruroides sculpturatus TaxID=218467 RepID=UPI000C6E0B4A|nr:uncharacterized protein LOC111627144 [Centruroides sculpturatus]
MLKTSHVVKFIGQLFPYRKALSGDRVGLIYGSPHKPVEKVISALDLTPEVMDQAVREQCDLIIVHHPFLYEVSLDLEWQKAPYKHLIHKRLVNTGIGLLVAHTNYDLIWQGMSEQVVETLSFASVRAIGTYRAGAILTTNLSMYQIFELIKRKLGIEIFRSNFAVPKNTRSDEHKIAILPGASDVRDILLAHQQGAQTILTSDVKWST